MSNNQTAAKGFWVPSRSDEVHVQPGDQLDVVREYPDGWILILNGAAKGFAPKVVIEGVSVGQGRPKPRHESLYTKDLISIDPLSPGKEGAPSDSDALKGRIKAKIKSLLGVAEARAQTPSNCGSLKIMVAGDAGIGKTSLIHAFTLSDAFVQHGPITSLDNTMSVSPKISELKASTIPPSQLRFGEDPNNITFVDTPGLGSFMDAMMVIKPVVEYVEAQFRPTNTLFSPHIPTQKLVNLLKSGTGSHSHVDVCIYCILHRLKPVDLEYMRLLSGNVTVIPVIIKADTMSAQEVFELKRVVIENIAKANIPIYGFGLGEQDLIDAARLKIAGAVPFAVCSKEREYGKCLDETELLKRGLFSNNVWDIRTLTAERFSAWRLRQ
ncbi:hypothetical protein BCR33DRAFT_850206 [Rhizoclosmatium globosum]|uniref:Septin-type G domain-containing protein n=1 Tax=Rhizoclosmatium globosum TaxID=329046 RepID=A0A1Y2CCA5_9FUNG|nr:hypothetical protein BCR33DRAFT_850206 [Rhizoclosmatium globosum]|eukprot:ORY44672.1 hypothetical protein BCR33DRAFT_850206 [Rhizoclosmatium globosum]